MFNFGSLWRNGIRPHAGAFAVVLVVAVVFVSTPIYAVWKLVKSVPVIGGALGAAERANPLS